MLRLIQDGRRKIQVRLETHCGRCRRAMIVAWMVCTTSAGCMASAPCRSRPTSRCSTNRGRGGCGGCSRDRDGAHDDRPLPLHDRTDAAGASTWHRATTSDGCGRSSTWLPSRASSTAKTAPGRGATVAGAADVGWTVPGGDLVRVRNPVTSGHTRVPRYLRRHVGRIERVAFAWPNPGESAATGNVRRAGAGVHGRLRGLRPVRPGRRPHRHRRPR